MPSPDVIERQVVDIALKPGVNEHDRPEVTDWTQWLTTSDNTAYDDYGVIKQRPGLVRYISQTDPMPGSFTDVLKAFRLPNGLGFYQFDTGKLKTGFYDLNERFNGATFKGYAPKYAVERQTISSWSTSVSSDICSIALADNYKVILTRTEDGNVTGARFFSIVMVDRDSSNIVRSYIYSPTPDVEVMRMVHTGGGRLHFYAWERAGAAARFWQLDTNSNLPPSGTISPVTTVLASNSQLCDAVPFDGGSVVCSVTGRLQHFDITGASVSTGIIAGISTVTGFCTDGTDFWVSGIDGAGTGFYVKTIDETGVVSTTSTLLHGGQAGAIRVARDQGAGVSEVTATIWRSGTSVSGVKYPRLQVALVDTSLAAFTIRATIAGWCEASLPFQRNGSSYVLAANQMSANSGANPSRDTVANSVCLIDIGYGLGFASGSPGMTPEAVVDGYIASLDANDPENGSYSDVTRAYPHKPVFDPTLNRDAYVATMNKVSSGSVGFDFIRLIPGKGSVLNGYDNCFAAAGMGVYYDAHRPIELGFVNAPSVFAQISSVGTGLPVGLHTYCVQYEYKCFDGQSRYSRPSRPTSVSLVAPKDVNVEFIMPGVGRSPLQDKQDKTVAHVYRTAAGGLVLYKIASIQISQKSTTFGLTDQLNDTDLITRPQMISQPLISGGPLARYHTLAPSCMVKHKDRVFYANKTQVYYSSFFVDGEAPWFNPVFSISVFGGTGDIIGLSSMDGVLVVFKEDAIFLIDGDGPPESGGSGTEFTSPRRIQAEFGCIDQRSILPVPDGLFFRSRRGIEMLTTNGRVNFVGDRVSTTVDSNKFTLGAVFDRILGRVLFMVAAVEDGPYRYVGAKIISMDLTTNAWSTWSPRVDVQDLVYANIEIVSGQPGVVYLGSRQSIIYVEFDGICLDGANGFAAPTYGGTYVPMTLETGWIRYGMNERMIAEELILRARNLDNHDLRVSVAYDFSNTYTALDSTMFEADNWVGEELQQLSFAVPQTECEGVRFKIEVLAPSDLGSFPVGKGRGIELMGFTVKLGKVGGGAKLSERFKG